MEPTTTESVKRKLTAILSADEETQPLKNSSNLKRLLDALRKAGLPD